MFLSPAELEENLEKIIAKNILKINTVVQTKIRKPMIGLFICLIVFLLFLIIALITLLIFMPKITNFFPFLNILATNTNNHLQIIGSISPLPNQEIIILNNSSRESDFRSIIGGIFCNVDLDYIDTWYNNDFNYCLKPAQFNSVLGELSFNEEAWSSKIGFLRSNCFFRKNVQMTPTYFITLSLGYRIIVINDYGQCPGRQFIVQISNKCEQTFFIKSGSSRLNNHNQIPMALWSSTVKENSSVFMPMVGLLYLIVLPDNPNVPYEKCISVTTIGEYVSR